MARTRHQADYEELFQLHLAEEIERGGPVYNITRLVRVYQRIDDGERREEFESWVRSTGAFTCNRCGIVFAPPEKVAEDDEVLCSLCRMR